MLLLLFFCISPPHYHHSYRVLLGCGLLKGTASIPTAAMGLPTAPSNLKNWNPPSEQDHPRPGSKTTTHPTDPSKLLVITPGKEKIQRERDRKFRSTKQIPLSTRSVAIPPSVGITQRRPIPSKSYLRMMGMNESAHGQGQGQGQGEMNNDATNGGNATGENTSHILTPQVPRIVPRFMGGKHIRGMGQGYQRRFAPKTFHIPGEEPSSQPPAKSSGKSKHDDEEVEGIALMSEEDVTKDSELDVSPTRVKSKGNGDDDDEEEVEVLLAPIWERPTRYSHTLSIYQQDNYFYI